jgi:vacuolar-type H+-ATPase subunit D/Vma8
LRRWQRTKIWTTVHDGYSTISFNALPATKNQKGVAVHFFDMSEKEKTTQPSMKCATINTAIEKAYQVFVESKLSAKEAELVLANLKSRIEKARNDVILSASH